MRKLNAAVDRFAYNHPRFGIPNLMKFIVIGNIVAFLLLRFSNFSAISFLNFSLEKILHGEIWRLVTFVFVPSSANLFTLGISLYFYYFIGNILEREWGTPKFNLYYFSGMALTVLTAVILSLASGQNVLLSGTEYVNLSMFLAFAMLFPDNQVLLFFFIPVKMKWLAWLGGALFATDILDAAFRLDLLGALLPVVALLNFLVFFWSSISDEVRYRRGIAQHRNSHQTIQFKSAVKQQAKKEQAVGYRHKCDVCGQTDADCPDLQFRYCSRCTGYHCFCEDHIFTHEHFTE